MVYHKKYISLPILIFFSKNINIICIKSIVSYDELENKCGKENWIQHFTEQKTNPDNIRYHKKTKKHNK